MKIIKNVSKSVYPIRYTVKGSFNLGEICPIGAPLEVIPGDYFKLNAAIALRMATPIAPIMDDLDAEITAHFVPLRLVSNKKGDETNNSLDIAINTTPRFEAIIGNGLGNPGDWTTTNHELYAAPTAYFNPVTAKTNQYTSIGEALGLGLGTAGTSTGSNLLAYPLYGYNLIYQERFRNQNVEAARAYDICSNVHGKAGTNSSTVDDSGLIGTYNQSLNVAYKHGDYFTNAVPSPTKGGPVEIPLGLKAPVSATADDHTTISEGLHNSSIPDLTGQTGNSLRVSVIGMGGGTIPTGYNAGDVIIDKTSQSNHLTNIAPFDPKNLWADLSAATAATIENFVTSYNVQQLLMHDIKGTRYYEVISNHFYIENEDIKLYVPELLMYRRFNINISPVVQQSGSAAATSATDQGNYLGTTGGYSFTANHGGMVSHAFGEFGYIYFLIVCRQRRTYGQGYPKMYFRSTRFDWFFPELGRIGFDKILDKQVDATAAAGTFGYTPAWQELRERGFNQVFGFMNPHKASSLDYWTLAEDLSSTPTLSMSFLKEDRTNLARALTIGSTGPDFIMDAMIYGKVSTFVPIGTEPKLFN